MVIEGGIIYTDLKGQALNAPVTIPGLYTQLMKNNQKQWVLFNFKDNNSLVVKPAMVAYGVYQNDIWGFTGNKQVVVTQDDRLTMTDYGGGAGGGDMTVAAYGGSNPNTVRNSDRVNGYGVFFAGTGNGIPSAAYLAAYTNNSNHIGENAGSHKIEADQLIPLSMENLNKQISINMDLLWENASPSSSFATQSIPISNMGDYKLFIVCCGYSKQYNTAGAGRGNVILPQTAGFCTVSNGTALFYRLANTTPSGFYFGDATQMLPPGASGKKNDSCIPVKIYGIK